MIRMDRTNDDAAKWLHLMMITITQTSHNTQNQTIIDH